MNGKCNICKAESEEKEKVELSKYGIIENKQSELVWRIEGEG